MSPPQVVERARATSPAFGAFRPGVVQIEIVLAYHQAVVRSGLRMLLDEERDFRVVAETADVAGALECVRAHHPAVLVLDLDQPTGSAVAAISLLVDESPATNLVVMSSRRDPAFVRAAIAAGARGYVPSAATAENLTSTIRRAASGTTAFNSALHASITASPSPTGPCYLSPREAEVLGLIAMGYTNAVIAGRLSLSVRTIETHRSHIRHKLERPRRAELVEYAFEHGIGQLQA